jgi:hypothetical protein
MVVGESYGLQGANGAGFDEVLCPIFAGLFDLFRRGGLSILADLIAETGRALAYPIRIAGRMHLEIAFSPVRIAHAAATFPSKRQPAQANCKAELSSAVS